MHADRGVQGVPTTQSRVYFLSAAVKPRSDSYIVQTSDSRDTMVFNINFEECVAARERYKIVAHRSSLYARVHTPFRRHKHYARASRDQTNISSAPNTAVPRVLHFLFDSKNINSICPCSRAIIAGRFATLSFIKRRVEAINFGTMRRMNECRYSYCVQYRSPDLLFPAPPYPFPKD